MTYKNLVNASGADDGLTIPFAQSKNKGARVAIDKEQIKRSVNLVELVGRRVELKKASGEEYHGPCPFCGGNNRFRVKPDYFACRPGDGHCGRSGDAIKFVMELERVDFVEACKILSGGTLPTGGAILQPVVKPAAPASPAVEFDEPEQRRRLEELHAILLDAKAPPAARECLGYLTGRGIEVDTLRAFTVAYDVIGLPGTAGKQKSPAVALPWFNLDGALQHIKYRYLMWHTYTDTEGKERKEKQKGRGAFTGLAFGYQALQGPSKRDVLIITEGEINALSIWQVANSTVDVISMGAQGAIKNLPKGVKDLAKQYKSRLVWADERSIADEAARSIGAYSMSSPDGKDANDLLGAGLLSPLLGAMLGKMGVTLPTVEPAPADGFWDVATGDPYRFVGHTLYLDEIEQLANVLGDRDYPMEVHAVQDGELWRVVLIAPKGAQLWTAPSGRLYAGRL